MYWLSRMLTRLLLVLLYNYSMYNLISLNVNGLNDQLKRTALIDSHAASHGVIQSWFRNSGFFVASSSVSNKRCGTAILVRDIFTITQVKRDDEGRFLQVEVALQDHKLRFVSL